MGPITGPTGGTKPDGHFEAERGVDAGADVGTRGTRYGVTCAFIVPKVTRAVDALRLLPTCYRKGTLGLG